MAYRPRPKKAWVDPDDPRMWATSDRSGFLSNQDDMAWQYQWAGNDLINLRILVHRDELDVPQEQLRTIILPPDPAPVFNARPEPYSMDETPTTTRKTQDGRIRVIFRGGGLFSERIISGDF